MRICKGSKVRCVLKLKCSEKTELIFSHFPCRAGHHEGYETTRETDATTKCSVVPMRALKAIGVLVLLRLKRPLSHKGAHRTDYG